MRLLENSVGEYADRLVSIERAYQLGIAHNIARIYADPEASDAERRVTASTTTDHTCKLELRERGY